MSRLCFLSAVSQVEMKRNVEQRLAQLHDLPRRNEKINQEQWIFLNAYMSAASPLIPSFPAKVYHNDETEKSAPDFDVSTQAGDESWEVTAAVPKSLAHARAVIHRESVEVFDLGYFRSQRSQVKDIRTHLKSGIMSSAPWFGDEAESEAASMIAECIGRKAKNIDGYRERRRGAVNLIIYENGPGLVDFDKLIDRLNSSLRHGDLSIPFPKIIVLSGDGSQSEVLDARELQ